MGMTREELKILVKGMKAVYSQPTFIPDQVATVEQSHFIRNYRAAVQRMKEDAKLPESVKTSITDMGKQYAQLTEKAEATQIATEEADASEKESEICMSGETRKRLDELYKTLNGKMQEETKK